MKTYLEPGCCAPNREHRPTCEDCPLRELVSKQIELTLGLIEKVDRLTATSSVILDYVEDSD